MATSKDFLTIFTGQRTQSRVVGRSYGIQRPALLDGLDWTPNLSVQTIMEFDNLNPALIYTTFDDVTVKMSYPANNQGIIESVLMDTDPTSDKTMVDPANMVPFTAFANLRGLDGNFKGSFLLRDITPHGNPFTGTVKEAAKRSLDGKALQALQFNGLAISYTRLRGNTVLVAPPVAPTLGQTGSGGTLGADTYYVALTAVTAAGETTVGPEASIQVVSGAVNEITATSPAIVSPITGYNVYIADRSGAWRLAGPISGTTLVITAMPGPSAVRPPVINTSGVPVATNDVVMTSSGGLYSGLLSVPAVVLPQSGKPYVLVKKNGVTIATATQDASADTFSISADGTTFSVLDSNAPTDWYDVFTLYKPNPA